MSAQPPLCLIAAIGIVLVSIAPRPLRAQRATTTPSASLAIVGGFLIDGFGGPRLPIP
jgi:hypothetical protein